MKKAIVITGTSSGLGKALVDSLVLRKDVHLLPLSRVRCDLSNTDAVRSLVEALCVELAEFSEIVFINNAAVLQPLGPVGELHEESMISAAHVNFVSPLLIANALCRLGRRLQIIHITTGAARNPVSGWSVYCATKAAMSMFLSVLRAEQRVEVHEFDPGVMDTDMQEEARSAAPAQVPRAGEFALLKEQGKLRSPQSVAAELIGRYLS